MPYEGNTTDSRNPQSRDEGMTTHFRQREKIRLRGKVAAWQDMSFRVFDFGPDGQEFEITAVVPGGGLVLAGDGYGGGLGCYGKGCLFVQAEAARRALALPDEQGPSYHAVTVTVDGKTYRIADHYALELTCNRVGGWRLWRRVQGQQSELIGGEYDANAEFVVRVGETEVCRGPTLEQETSLHYRLEVPGTPVFTVDDLRVLRAGIDTVLADDPDGQRSRVDGAGWSLMTVTGKGE